jgi:putative salt-induced outer membrane protein YdiY
VRSHVSQSIFLKPFAFLGLVLFTAQNLHADVVVMKNGDRMTGTAVKLEGGKLTFKTGYTDSIIIAWDQVTSLRTDTALVLPTAQQPLKVTSVERTSTGMLVATSSGEVTLEPSAVSVLRSAADQAAYEAALNPNWGRAWAGVASVSLAMARGNSQTTTFGTGLTMTRQTRNDKTSLYAATLYSHDGRVGLTTANLTSGGLRYDHNLKPSVFAFGTGDFSSNGLQNLDLRSILGGGLGWHAIAAPTQTLDLLGGLVWTHEKYSPSPTNSFAALDLGEQYTRKMGAGSQLAEQAFFYPNLQQTGQYQFSFDSTFSTRLAKIFSWQFTFSDRYTSFPPAGTNGNDVLLTTGIGITLARK